MPKRLSFTTIFICILGTLGALFLVIRPGVHRHALELKTYLADAKGLKVGAPVRLAGVDVGMVTRVQARPEIKDTPAEIVMMLRTSYPIEVPKDASVVLVSVGALGETYPEIDVKGTSGPTAKSGDVLQSRNPGSGAMEVVLQRPADAGAKPQEAGRGLTAVHTATPQVPK